MDIRLRVAPEDLLVGDRPWAGHVEVLEVLHRGEGEATVRLRGRDGLEYEHTYLHEVWTWRETDEVVEAEPTAPAPRRLSNERELAETESAHREERFAFRDEYRDDLRRETAGDGVGD